MVMNKNTLLGEVIYVHDCHSGPYGADGTGAAKEFIVEHSSRRVLNFILLVDRTIIDRSYYPLGNEATRNVGSIT